MALYPDVQRRGQEEVDRVIGSKRLPKVSDRTSLPYVEHIMREVLRWRPVAPLGLPHVLTCDDNYDGYHIPTGAIVIPNIWSVFPYLSRF
jgi:cytochrome P450